VQAVFIKIFIWRYGMFLAQNTTLSASMKGKHITSILDLSTDEINVIFSTSKYLKSERQREFVNHILPGKVLAMIFEKPSTRTRVSFETGIYQLGGYGLYLTNRDLQLGRGETIADTAKVLSRYVDGIMARVFSHNTILELAQNSSVPVINGLDDDEHPCQALTDLFTMEEKFGSLKGRKLAYVGDGNNVCVSLMYTCAKLGVNFSGAFPEGYFPPDKVIEKSIELTKDSDSVIELGTDPVEIVTGADAVYTDVWVSMGQDEEREEKLRKLQPYRVNADLVRHASPHAIVLHCLPAHRGEEITDQVLDGPQSAVFDQAENRLHVQKGIMALIMT
jgi:ornithine carbamoyltransferase